MQEFTNWTVDTIRSDKLLGAWLEERKFDWLPLVSQTIINIIDKINTEDNKLPWLLVLILLKILSLKKPEV